MTERTSEKNLLYKAELSIGEVNAIREIMKQELN